MSIRHGLLLQVTFRLAASRSDASIDGMLAHAALALSLVVRIYNAYGVVPETLTSARESADRIMTSAGIRVTWVQCPCDAAVGAAELVVRITSAPPANDSHALGFSYVDITQKGGTLATVFGDRVQSLAHVADVGEGDLLGRAIAHEIAHLLLGTRDHTRVGLMRGTWTSIELANNRPIDWQLSRSDSARLRQALARRLQTPPSPASVIAVGAEWPPSSVSAE